MYVFLVYICMYVHTALRYIQKIGKNLNSKWWPIEDHNRFQNMVSKWMYSQRYVMCMYTCCTYKFCSIFTFESPINSHPREKIRVEWNKKGNKKRWKREVKQWKVIPFLCLNECLHIPETRQVLSLLLSFSF